MKKIIVLIVAAMSLSLVIFNCGKDDDDKGKNKDTTSPVISLPSNDTLILDLGDKTAALSGVIAKDDKDGEITTSIELLGDLETVGFTTLKYTVYDEAKNKGTAERPAIVKSRKLVGRYDVEIQQTESLPMAPFVMTITEKNVTGLSVKNFHAIEDIKDRWNPATITLIADGPGKFKIHEDGKFPLLSEGNSVYEKITGEVSYGKDDKGEYIITSFSYTISGDGLKDLVFTSPKCKLLPR
jgi:hypothetical protein